MAFDPYHVWLGIRREEQPVDYYRLLAIARFEKDADVIESAADRQMAHVRTFQTGPHSADSQRILNELSAANICLLDAEKHAAYDALLRRRISAASSQPPALPGGQPQPATQARAVSPAPVNPPASPVIITRSDSPSGGAATKGGRRRGPLTAWMAVGVTAVAAIAIAVLIALNSHGAKKDLTAEKPPSQSPDVERVDPEEPNPKAVAQTPKIDVAESGAKERQPEIAHVSPQAVSSPKKNAQLDVKTDLEGAKRDETSSPSAPPKPENGLTIVEARWGADENWADVTAAMQADVFDGRYVGWSTRPRWAKIRRAMRRRNSSFDMTSLGKKRRTPSKIFKSCISLRTSRRRRRVRV